jgi:hypothetical protein
MFSCVPDGTKYAVLNALLWKRSCCCEASRRMTTHQQQQQKKKKKIASYGIMDGAGGRGRPACENSFFGFRKY